MWGWAIKRCLIKLENPCLHLDQFKEVKRQRYLSLDEVDQLGVALRQKAQRKPYAVKAIKMLIMTGARLGEILSARWEWIGGDVLRLPDD